MSNVKAAVVAALVYLRDQPGAVSFIVGEAVVVGSSVGLNLNATQLAQGAAVLLPILLGYFHLAKKASAKAALKAANEAADVPVAAEAPQA